jgi:hypothetical protein
MTDLARALPESVLRAVDRYRAQHGIRNRAKALELMVQEVVPEHPLEAALRNAPKLPKGSVSRETLEKIKQAETEPKIPLQEAMRLRKLRQNAS